MDLWDESQDMPRQTRDTINAMLILSPALFVFLVPVASMWTCAMCMDSVISLWASLELMLSLARMARRIAGDTDKSVGVAMTVWSAAMAGSGVYCLWQSRGVCESISEPNLLFWLCLIVVITEFASAICLLSVFGFICREEISIAWCAKRGINDPETCGICANNMKNQCTPSLVHTAECGHAFHRACAESWFLDRGDECPTCQGIP